MKIQVEDKLFVESDERQFLIKEYNGKFDEKGKEGYKVLGYFSTLNQAVKHLIKLEFMGSTADTFQGLIDDVTRIEKKIEGIIKI
jgi:hypothetical protein